MFALIDCNNFYASCERVFRPDLVGKPVVVLSNNDGCVIARSNEAKVAGIPMGAPAYQFEELFKQKSIHVFSANFELYGDMSNRVMTLLGEYSSEIEIYSIDEAFLKFDSNAVDLDNLAQDIQKRVTKSTGIPISVGFAPTKTLAKVANRIAKKYAATTQNVYIIKNDEQRIKALKWLKIEDVWGLGRQLSKKLNIIDVYNALEFTQLSDSWVRKNLSVVGLRTKHELQGINTISLETHSDRKNIATTRSFERNYSEFKLLQERVATFAISCAEKLRKQHSVCNSMLVFIKSNRHRSDLSQHNQSIVLKLPFPTNSNIELSKFAQQALVKIYKPGIEYKKAGVVLMDFNNEKENQISLFENSNQKHAPIMMAIDQLNSKYGQHKIKLASQDLKRTWKMKQEKISKRYSTRLEDIITVKV